MLIFVKKFYLISDRKNNRFYLVVTVSKLEYLAINDFFSVIRSRAHNARRADKCSSTCNTQCLALRPIYPSKKCQSHCNSAHTQCLINAQNATSLLFLPAVSLTSLTLWAMNNLWLMHAQDESTSHHEITPEWMWSPPY